MSEDLRHTPLPKSKRRRFQIQSGFGGARQWRSRKRRPCDACRRRKTACVIDTEPPCGYCRSKGIACRATAVPPSTPLTPSPVPEEEEDEEEEDDDNGDEGEHDGNNNVADVSIMSDAAAPASRPAPHAPPIIPTSSVGAVSPQDELHLVHPPMSWNVAVPGAVAPSTSSLSPASAPLNSGVRHEPATTATAVPPAVADRNIHDTTVTLEDNPNRTPHVMGLAAEQDAELLVSFRSAVRNELNRVDADIIQVYGGDVCSNRPPVHFSLLQDEFAPMDNAAKQAASDHIEFAVHGFADELVRLYFAHVHPVYPLLSKARFLRAYAENKTSLPASLRGVVYGLAANFWRLQQRRRRASDSSSARAAELSTPPALTPGPRNGGRLHFSHHRLFEDALASLQRELHGPDLWTLQACLLLLHENSAENATMETPRVWALTAQAVACAQMNGLHRDPGLWSLPPWEKRLRRRLWWATVAADAWSALCHGNPPHVYDASFTTAALTMDDVAPDEEEADLSAALRGFLRGGGGGGGADEDRAAGNSRAATGSSSSIAACARFTTTVSLSCIVHDLLMSSFLDTTYSESMKDPVARETMLLGFRLRLRNWSSLLPRCLDMDYSQVPSGHVENNAPVHLAFYAAVALTYRALMSPVTKAAKQDAGSRLRRYFSAAVGEFSPFVDFMRGISAENLHAFWGVHARSQLIVCGNFLIYLFLLAPTAAEIQETFQILSRFHDSLQRLSAMADGTAIDLLRPVALRIDTFFTQSAQTMHGHTARLG